MTFDLNLSARLEADDVKAAVAEMCRRKIAEILPGAAVDGEFQVSPAYGYIPEVKVSYVPKAREAAGEEQAAEPVPAASPEAVSAGV